MQLKFKGVQHNDSYCVLGTGDTTDGVVEMPESHKAMLLESFPDLFELIAEELTIQTPEDSLTITNGEAKLAKLTRKK